MLNGCIVVGYAFIIFLTVFSFALFHSLCDLKTPMGRFVSSLNNRVLSAIAVFRRFFNMLDVVLIVNSLHWRQETCRRMFFGFPHGVSVAAVGTRCI